MINLSDKAVCAQEVKTLKEIEEEMVFGTGMKKAIDRSFDKQTQPLGIDATLEERGRRYGEFAEHARITQRIKAEMRNSSNWCELPFPMKESLEMIAHKIGRILNGDPDYADSWHDISGYAKLVEDELESD